MGIKKQLLKIKDNWLLVLLILVLFAAPMFYPNGSVGYAKSGLYEDMAMPEMAMARGGVMYDESFAPEIIERKITKTSNLNSEIERGKFKSVEIKLKAIISATDSYLINENSNKYGEGIRSYYNGYYQIKVQTNKYDLIIEQLKELGEVTSFNENKRDITESYTDNSIELAVEKERLARFEQMYSSATDISDKIELNDKIFDQERRIQYLEESLENMDSRIDYSTISVSLTEKRSGYVGVALVKFSRLVRTLIDSFNGVLSLIFWIIPWALITLIIWVIYRNVKRK
jgi:hypothetical protein